MPTEPIAALLYICLLLPGVAFIWSYEGHRSLMKRTAFRETAAVVIASVTSIVAVFLVHYLLGFFWEPAAKSLREFFLEPGKLFREDSQLFLGVVLVDLLAAILVGLFLGSRPADTLRRKLQTLWRKALNRDDADVMDREQSGWLEAFRAAPDERIHVGIQLKSGAWLQGILWSYTKTGDEVPERALTLRGRIHYRMAGSENLHAMEDFSTVVVQAAEIDHLMVGYEPIEHEGGSVEDNESSSGK
ncbi:DUF6338 family protein [Arthrobacter sp. UNC362MFTsu5.1]|uniref:DUF6338 family protein n=1 Tax=Arthrobacter sp. UNC362MFTsu5.1 TaxID=1449044 RepID=UPI0012DC6DE5|nr:DUF6338 family protein [Arthrobacter sp. UNC362MFTsu5.1]